MSENLYEDIRLIDAEAQGDRLVTFLDEQRFNELDVNEFRDFLATLEGIEFGPITFDDNEVFGASFLNNEQNSDKIEAAGYSLMVSSQGSIKNLLSRNPDLMALGMAQELSDECKLLDTKVLGNQVANGVRLVTSLDEQHFNALNADGFRDLLATLDGIEFFSITYDGNNAFGASFLCSDENSEKIEAAGYILRIFFK
mgnify:FL=1|jgi:hypothetical protein